MWRGWIYLRGLRRHDDALMTAGNGAPGFAGRRFDRSRRENGLRNETGTGRGPDVDNPVVVDPRTLDLEIEILNGADCLTADARRRGIEYGIIDTVGIHRGQPRVRVVDALGDLTPDLRLRAAILRQCTRWGQRTGGSYLSFDHPAFFPVSLHSNVRNEVAPFCLRHALHPQVGHLHDMVINGSHAKSQCHGITFPNERNQGTAAARNHHRLFTWLQFVDPLRIFNQNLVLFLFRNSLEAPFQPLVGRRPDRRRMREVRLPQDPVDANVITQLNACLLVPEVDVTLLAEDIAWLALEPIIVKLVAFPFVVAGFKHVRNPPDAALCANEGQLWEALKHAAEQEIGKNL